MTAWLTGTLVYTGLLIALVLLVRRPFSRWFGPQFAYALWALPALRLLLPPIELPASLAPQQAHQLSDQALLAPAMAPEASPTAAPAPTPLWERTDLWLALWLFSAALFLAWRIASYFRMCRELLAEARPVGEVGRIRLVETPAVSSPVAFGVRDKVVALPPRFMAMGRTARRAISPSPTSWRTTRGTTSPPTSPRSRCLRCTGSTRSPGWAGARCAATRKPPATRACSPDAIAR